MCGKFWRVINSSRCNLLRGPQQGNIHRVSRELFIVSRSEGDEKSAHAQKEKRKSAQALGKALALKHAFR